MHQLPQSGEWVLVRADILPEVYGKVIATREALAAGRCASVSEAVREFGISRSAYYKYKDAVTPYVGNHAEAALMTVELTLQDCPGVLSALLSAFAKTGANIVTVNQQPPSGGSAQITLCAKTDGMSMPMDKFTKEITKIPGVQRINSIRCAETT